MLNATAGGDKKAPNARGFNLVSLGRPHFQLAKAVAPEYAVFRNPDQLTP
jgi:hypothetical protein